MTVRAIVGLVLFNLAVCSVGASMLWGMGAVRWWTHLVGRAGVAYLLGLASVMIVLTLELVLGVPVGAVTIVLTFVGLIAVPLVLGIRSGYARSWQRPAGWRLPRITPLSAVLVAVVVVYLEGVFRAARLSSALGEWDGWWIWLPKAKAIYYFGALHPELLEFFPHSSGSYPPGLPAVHSAAYHAMGSADDVTLHLQYWFYVAGFVAAVAGLLVRRAPWIMVFPSLLVALVCPSVVTRITWTYADLPVGYLVAVGALLLILWIEERQTWQLVAASILLTGAMLTKREGLIFAAAVLLAGFVASFGQRRSTWRFLAVAGISALALALPWRVWLLAHGLPSETGSAGFLGVLTDLDRAWPSLDLVVTTLFDPEFWLLLPALAVAAMVLAAVAGQYQLAIYTAAFTCFAVAGAAWTIWADPALPISQDDGVNPIVRMTGTTVLTLAALTPLLLARAWSRGQWDPAARPSARLGPDPATTPSHAAWSVVVVAALAYPASMLGGLSGRTLPGGMPQFPSSSDCVSDPVPGRSVRVVVGYADSYQQAQDLGARAVAAGLRGVDVSQDGCGRLRVFVDELTTVAAGAKQVADARDAGLQPTLEGTSPRPGEQK